MTTTDSASLSLRADTSVRLRIFEVQIPTTMSIDGVGIEAVEFLEWAGFCITGQNEGLVRARQLSKGVNLMFRSGIFLEYRRPSCNDKAVFFKMVRKSDQDELIIDEGYFVPRRETSTNHGPVHFHCYGYSRDWELTCEEPIDSQLLPAFSPLADGQMTLDDQMDILRRAAKKAKSNSKPEPPAPVKPIPIVKVDGKVKKSKPIKNGHDLGTLNLAALFDHRT